MAYHHGNLRAALLDVAMELGRTGGPAAITMREVTRQAGVSVRAAYRHFPDLDALLGEVAALAMDQISDSIIDRLAAVEEADAVDRARARLRAVGAGYIEFGLREPGLFDTAYYRTVGVADVEKAHPFRFLCDALDHLITIGAIAPDRRTTAPVECWAAVHGFVVLHRGPLFDLQSNAVEVAMVSLLNTIERGLVAP